MLFSGGIIVLTICIYSSLAATVVIPENVSAEPMQPRGSEEPEIEFTSEVHKEMPPPVNSELNMKKHVTDSLKTVEDIDKGPDGKKHIVSTTATDRTQERKKTEQHSDNELGHVVDTHFDGNNQEAFIGGREVTSHSSTLDMKMNGVLNGQIDTSIKGENKVQQLRNGQMTTGNVTRENEDYQHFAGNNVRTQHPDDDHTISIASQTDNIRANNGVGHRTTMQQTLHQPYNSIQLTDVFSDEDKVHTQTNFSHKQIATDTPEALLKINKITRKTNVNATSEKREKLLIERSTPLSHLFVLDIDGQQNKKDFEREIVNINTTADNKKGTVKTKNETIQRQVEAQTAKHLNSFKFTKTPLKGSHTLPVTVVLETVGTDRNQRKETKQNNKVTQTVTPNGKKNEEYTERTSTEYDFKTTPSKPDENTTDNEGHSDVSKVSNHVSGSDDEVVSQSKVLSKSTLNKSPKQTKVVEKSDKRVEEKVDSTTTLEKEHSTSSESNEVQSDIVNSASKPETTVPQRSRSEHANTDQDITTQDNHQDEDDDQHNDTEKKTEHEVTTADADEYYGTMILLIPGDQVEGEDPIVTFKKRGITKKNLELVKFAKENRLASNIVIAGLVNKEKITEEKIDDFLYNFSEKAPVGVINISPFTNEGQMYALKKK